MDEQIKFFCGFVLGVVLMGSTPMSVSASLQPADPAVERGGSAIWLGSLRNSFGGAWYFSPAERGGFQYDLTAGVHVATGTDSGLVLRPLLELGYSRHGGDVENGCGNYFVTGAGLSFGGIEWALSAVPSFIIGDSRGDSVYGFRTALRADFFFGIWSVEVGHEWRSVRDTGVHSLRGMIAIDLGTGISWAMQAMAPRGASEASVRSSDL